MPLSLVLTPDSSGVESARPLANAVAAGYVYFATDVNVYSVSNSLVWFDPKGMDAVEALGYAGLLTTSSIGAATGTSLTLTGGITIGNAEAYKQLDNAAVVRNLLTLSAANILTVGYAASGVMTVSCGSNISFAPSGTGAVIRFTGNGIFLGGDVAPTYLLTLSGQAARTLGSARNTSSNTAGNSLTITSGGASAAASNKASGALILTTGISTGTNVPALLRLQGTAPTAASATTDNAQIDKFIPNGFKALTDAGDIAFLSLTIATETAIGVMITYTIEATDLTDFQSETGYVFVSAVNKGGVVTRTITESADTQQALSAGTLATTFAVTAASPAVVSVTADTSLTVGSGYIRINFSVTNFTHQAIAIV